MISPRDRIQEEHLSPMNVKYEPLPGSRKIYKSSAKYPDLRVPAREVALSDSVDPQNNRTANPAVELYDTSGPYTDPDKTVEQVVKEAVGRIGENVSVRRFARFVLGEGLNKKADDFAAEVAELTGGKA